MPKNIIITCAEGQTGHLIAEQILTNDQFSQDVSVHLFSCNPEHPHVQELAKMGDHVNVVECTPGDPKKLEQQFKDSGADGIVLIPPSVDNKLECVEEMAMATKGAGIQSVVLISAAGCDVAEKDKQPRVREFIEIEHMMMKMKGEPETGDAGHSQAIIRAGFYAENLLLYNKYAKDKGKLPLPIGDKHKFAPIALGDIALLAAHTITSEGEHGLGDHVRGQLMTLTGPMMTAGEELADAASQGLGTNMEYEDISEEDAVELLKEAEISESEKEYLLQYYSLVREGKLNYISTHCFHDVLGEHPMEMTDFFKSYAEEFKPKKRKTSS
ncbi:hypothetical protein FPQ18DRAFT_252693 [Pyronema domesticum]|nr:hypothetical protein FPQ18DRAFT_252693 [Pyronema domesticum]